MSGRSPPLLYTYKYINRHAGPPNKTKYNVVQNNNEKGSYYIRDDGAIEPYSSRAGDYSRNFAAGVLSNGMEQRRLARLAAAGHGSSSHGWGTDGGGGTP